MLCATPATPSAEMSPTPGAAASTSAPLWPASNLFKALPTDWWLTHWAWLLHRTYDISPLGAVMLPLSVAGAMAGGFHWIVGPSGLSYCAPFNAAFIGGAGSLFRTAADKAWMVPRGFLSNFVNHTDAQRRSIDKQLEGLYEELASAIQGIQAAEDFRANVNPINIANSEKQECCELKKKRLLRQICDLRCTWGQLFVNEGCELKSLLKPDRLTFDRNVHHLSTNGAVVSRLKAASKSLLADLSEETGRLMTGFFYQESNGVLHQGMISNGFFLSEAQARELLGSQHLRSVGFLDSFLSVDMRDSAASLQEFESTMDVSDANLSAIVLRLMEQRCNLMKYSYKLTPEALNRCESYIQESCQRVTKLKARHAPIFEQIEVLLLKLALAIHLTTEGPAPNEINLKTMSAACVVLDALLASHLTIRDDMEPAGREGRELAPGETQIEVIIARIRCHGPLKFRDLARTMNVQRSDVLAPLLAKVIDQGIVVKTPDGRFALADGADKVDAPG